jgi:hypothetical protein
MKILMFHLMPYRNLPADFEQRYHSVWLDPPWWELTEVQQVHRYYNWTLDELIYGARLGSMASASTSTTRTPIALCPAPTSWAPSWHGPRRAWT